MARVLTTLLKAKGYNKVEVFQDKTIVWAANYYGIDVSHYMKDVDL